MSRKLPENEKLSEKYQFAVTQQMKKEIEDCPKSFDLPEKLRESIKNILNRR